MPESRDENLALPIIYVPECSMFARQRLAKLEADEWLKGVGGGNRETTGYEPFALHAPIQWAMQGNVNGFPN